MPCFRTSGLLPTNASAPSVHVVAGICRVQAAAAAPDKANYPPLLGTAERQLWACSIVLWLRNEIFGLVVVHSPSQRVHNARHFTKVVHNTHTKKKRYRIPTPQLNKIKSGCQDCQGRQRGGWLVATALNLRRHQINNQSRCN